MTRQALDFYGEMPKELKAYLRYNGWHFNRKACEYAVSLMKVRNNTTGKVESLEQMTKDQVEDMLKKNNITLENALGYDHVYVANMLKADCWKSSIEDERHHALGIKDAIDDIDKPDGFIMHRWYADMIRAGIPVEWEDLL